MAMAMPVMPPLPPPLHNGNGGGSGSDAFPVLDSLEIQLELEVELEAEDLSDLTPAAALLKFLAFFARGFDPLSYGISVGRGRLGSPFPLEHPVDPLTGVRGGAALTIEVSSHRSLQ